MRYRMHFILFLEELLQFINLLLHEKRIRSQMFFRVGVLKDFKHFTEKDFYLFLFSLSSLFIVDLNYYILS